MRGEVAGIGSEIISHPPHETIGRHRHAFDRLKQIGLLIEAPFNQHGVKRITCTEDAAKIGRERMLENMRAALSPRPADGEG